MPLPNPNPKNNPAPQALARVNTPRGARPPPDPRNALNAHGHTPAAVAAHHGADRLVEALLPGVPVGRVVDVHELLSERGPPALRDLAAAAWRAGLGARLGALAARTAAQGCLESRTGGCAAAAVDIRKGEDGRCGASDDASSSGRAGGGCGPISGDSLDSAWCCEGARSAACSPAPPSPGSAGGSCCGQLADGAARTDSLQSSIEIGAEFDVQSTSEGEEDGRSERRLPGHFGDHPHPHHIQQQGAVSGHLGTSSPCSSQCEVLDSENEELICGVCYELPASMLVLQSCGHRLCLDCTRGVVQLPTSEAAAPTCPFCRGTITGFGLAES
jgi:hypothetical protein